MIPGKACADKLAPEIRLPFGLFAEATPAFDETARSRDLSGPKNYCVNLMGRMHPGLTMDSAQAKLPALATRLSAIDVSGSTTGRDLVLAKLARTSQPEIMRRSLAAAERLRRVPGQQAVSAYRRELHELDPELPILQMTTFADFMEKNFTLRMVNLGAKIFGVFGSVALLLASVGVYGVKTYAVARRTREIGIRIALGPNRADVFALIMKQGLQQTVLALSVGVGLSLLAGRALAAIFFQVQPADPLVLALAAAVLAGSTLLACFVPARRATRVSPLSALRAK